MVNKKYDYDSIGEILCAPVDTTHLTIDIEKVLVHANRDVGLRDMLGFMFINIWVVLAPFFVSKK